MNKKTKVWIIAVCAANLIILLYGTVMLSKASHTLLSTEAAVKKNQTELQYSLSQESYDETTGLYKEENFLDIVNDKRKNLQSHTALIYITFKSEKAGNDLKFTNDHYGHIAGNQVLKDFSAAIKKVYAGSRYVLCHRGGSAFYVLDTDYQGKTEATETIMNLKAVWHDTPWVFENAKIDSPALNAVESPVTAQTNIEELQHKLSAASRLIRANSNFAFQFLQEN